MRRLVRYYKFERAIQEAYIYMQSSSLEGNLQIDARGADRSPLLPHWTDFLCMYVDNNYFALLLVTIY